MKNNIVLIGMMGSGKTTLGKELSLRLGMDFMDTDDVIEQKHGKITDIFAKEGEQCFRDIEASIIASLRNLKGFVIATGGGAILREKNVSDLREIGYIIYLRATVNTLLRNLSSDKVTRPLLMVDNPGEKLEEILGNRRDIYMGASDYIIDVDDKSIEEICNLVIQYYQMNNNNNV